MSRLTGFWRFLFFGLSPVLLLSATGVAVGQMPYYTRANALFLDQIHPDQKVLTTSGNAARLFTDSVDQNLETGIELTLGYFLDDVTIFESTYFGLHHWSESASVNGNANLNAPFSAAGAFLNDFEDANQQGFNQTSEIHNVEFNLKRQLSMPVWFIVGLRYIDYDETFNFFSADPNGDVGQYNVSAKNQMLGLQIGGEGNYWITDWLELSGTLKAGVFANFVDQNTLLINNNSVFAQGGKSGTSLGGLIDFNFMAAVGRGNWRCLAGYRVLVFGGMALAADQLDFSINEDPGAVLGRVNDQGSTVLHGPWAGVIGEF